MASKTKFVGLLAFLAVLALTACEGPAGISGSNGTDGVDGTDGTDSAIPLIFAPDSINTLGLARGGGTMVSVGYFGQIATSPDGSTWTSRTSGVSDQLRGVAYGNGLFVAVGKSGTILRSGDAGVTWTAASVRPASTVTLTGVAYGAGVFVAVGYYYDGLSTYTPHIWFSTDASNWTDVSPSGSFAFSTIAFVNGAFYAGAETQGSLYTSATGTTWSSTPSATFAAITTAVDGIAGIAYGNGVYVLAGTGGQIYTSADGTTWTQRSCFFTGTTTLGIAFHANRFVVMSLVGSLYSTTDGLAWFFPYITVPASTGGGYTTFIFSSDESGADLVLAQMNAT